MPQYSHKSYDKQKIHLHCPLPYINIQGFCSAWHSSFCFKNLITAASIAKIGLQPFVIFGLTHKGSSKHHGICCLGLCWAFGCSVPFILPKKRSTLPIMEHKKRLGHRTHFLSARSYFLQKFTEKREWVGQAPLNSTLKLFDGEKPRLLLTFP